MSDGRRAPGAFFAAVDDELLVVEVIVGGIGTAAGAGAVSAELELIVVSARGAGSSPNKANRGHHSYFYLSISQGDACLHISSDRFLENVESLFLFDTGKLDVCQNQSSF